MAGKRYRAKDRTVAKMERTGLVEENVRTGEKTRTSEGSTREITFDGRSDSGSWKGHAILNDNVSSSRSSSRNTGSRRFHRSRDLRERETDGSGKQEPFKSYSNASYPEKEGTGESPYLGDQKENGSRQEDYTNIRNNRAENAETGETSNNRDHNEISDSKERTRNRRKAAEKYREQDSTSRERPDGFPDESDTGINATLPDDHLPGISTEDLHRKIRKDQVRQGFQKAQAVQGQGFSTSGETVRPGTGSHSYSTGTSVPGAENGAEALSSSLQRSKLMFGDESSGMVRGAGMAMAGHAAGKLAYGAGRYAYRRLGEDTQQDTEAIGDSTANDAIHQAERPVRRKSEKLRKLLEKRKHVLRKYESIEERLKTIDESIRQEEEREILETFRNFGMDGSNLAVLLDQVQDGSDLAARLNAVFREVRVCAEKEDEENQGNQRKPVIENNQQHADQDNGD